LIELDHIRVAIAGEFGELLGAVGIGRHGHPGAKGIPNATSIVPL
jgi:hypothetical protein